MSISQEQDRVIIFYGWRRSTGATAAVRNISSALGKDVTTIITIHRWFTSFAKGDTVFEDKPRSGRPHAVEDSAAFDVVKEDPEATTRSLVRRLGCTNRQSSTASKHSATEKC